MPQSDAFALKNSDLNAFLFAEVGTEANGSSLTILSVLARLGQDPWTEAARWAKLPQAATIDCLADSISQMPLGPKAHREAHVTAARLVLLLPAKVQSFQKNTILPDGKFKIPEWIPIVVFCAALALGTVFALIPSMIQTGAAMSQTALVTGQPRTLEGNLGSDAPAGVAVGPASGPGTGAIPGAETAPKDVDPGVPFLDKK